MKEPKMHQAVVDNDPLRIRELIKSGEPVDQKNRFGLTPLDLARLLRRRACESLMAPPTSKAIKIQAKGKNSAVSRAPAEFETIFNIPYLETLRFQDYKSLVKAIKNCPYILRLKSLENAKMAETYRSELENSVVADVSVRWIDDRFEYGLFAEKEFDPDEWIGEYTGVVRQYFRRHPDTNPYCIHYPTKLWSLNYHMIDAGLGGNEMRFANHSGSPNMTPFCLVKNRLLHLVLFTNRKVRRHEQLTFNYGKDFWRKRQMFSDPA